MKNFGVLFFFLFCFVLFVCRCLLCSVSLDHTADTRVAMVMAHVHGDGDGDGDVPVYLPHFADEEVRALNDLVIQSQKALLHVEVSAERQMRDINVY